MLYMKHNSMQPNLIMHTLPHLHTCTHIHTHLQPLAFLSLHNTVNVAQALFVTQCVFVVCLPGREAPGFGEEERHPGQEACSVRENWSQDCQTRFCGRRYKVWKDVSVFRCHCL